MIQRLLVYMFIFTNLLYATEYLPLFLDAPKKAWNVRQQCVLSIANHTKLIRVSHKSIDILNEKDLSLDKTLSISWQTNKVKCLLSEDEKYLFLSTYYNIQMYDVNKLELYRTFPLENKSIYYNTPIYDIKKLQFNKKFLNNKPRDDSIVNFSFSPDKYFINILTSKRSLYRLDVELREYQKVSDRSDYPNNDANIELEGNSLIIYNYKNTKSTYSFDIETKKLSEYSKKSKRRILCSNKEGTRYVKKAKTSYDVYDVTSSKPLLKLTKKNRRDENSKGINAVNCLLYNDTLLIIGESLQKINLINKDIDYSKTFYPLKTLPIMMWAENDNYIISHNVSAFYGWDKKMGKQVWENVGPYLNRNHWDQAELFMSMYKYKAVTKPYGWSGDYINGQYKQNIYWTFNIKEGTYIFTPTKKEPEQSSISITHSYLYKGEQNYFTLNGVKFINLDNSEWLVISKEGYFNASSINVLNNIYMKENSNKRKLNEEEIFKWYRPDILASILQKKDFEKLEPIKHNFKLPIHSNIKNQYKSSLVREYLENKNSNALSKLGRLKDLSNLPFFLKVLEKASTQKEYLIAYNSLKNYSYKSIKEVISHRIKHLNKKSVEQSELIRFLYAKNQDLAIHLVSDFIKKEILTSASKKVVAQSITKYRFKNHELSKEELNITWEVWEKQNYIANEYILNICSKYDTSRAHKNAISTLIYLHNNHKKAVTPWCPARKDNTREKSTIEGSFSSVQLMLYKYLYNTKIPIEVDKLKQSTNKQINRFLQIYEFCVYGINELLKLQIKYNN